MKLTGKCSTFGGPHDTGVSIDEGLALIESRDWNEWWFRYLFQQHINPQVGLARNLDPMAYYCACRWDYKATPREQLRFSFVRVSANGKLVYCRPVDWGPDTEIKRVIDLSPGAANKLGVKTDDSVTIELVPLLS